MANATKKITLATARDIPFDKLSLSQANVRRIKAGISVEELAESIARRGLIQSLHVRPLLDKAGAETGRYEVPAGGRRFRALELLVRQKRLPKTAPVPCIVSEASSGILIDEVSLAENIERAPLHPLDQFRAFLALRDKGMTEAEIAAAFFVAPQVVKQRLRLTAVAPALLEVYAEDAMTLEQLMAFTVSDDHDRQVQVWEAVRQSWQKEPWQIRRMLTEQTVRAGDRRARFVGLEAYVEAGGAVMRDLFEEDGGGWLQDVPLLERLVAERLSAEAEAIAAEGWKWIEVATDFPYGHTHGLRRLTGTTVDLTEAERAEREALRDEYDALEAEYEGADEFPDAVDARLGEIEAALEAFNSRPLQFDADELARAGVFISLRTDGTLSIERGYVRPEDEEPVEPVAADTDSAIPEATAPQPVIATPWQAPAEEEDEGIRPLPDRLLTELTAYRTLALRDAVARNPEVALTALLHRLVTDTFHHRNTSGCLQASIQHVYLPSHAEGLNDSPAAQSIAERHEGWEADLPGDDAALWDWIAALDSASRLALLAHCVSYGVNALYEKPTPYSSSGVSEHGLQVRLSQADRLVRATSLDMADAGWRPTVANYLGRVTKAQILEAVREGAGEARAKALEGLKKGDMAREAEQLLAGTGWLPEPLRVPGGVSEDGPDTDQADTAADDDAETASPEGDPDRIAAE
ncbi:MAG: ParB/RepB/Spo0J family partition protein [Pararhodobacter sp.]|nr:ParB/RepB/Spo0J family partition protein [Pararhodobacter sp.]